MLEITPYQAHPIKWILLQDVPFWIEIPLIVFISIFLYVFVLMKIVRRFWQFPAPAFIGRGLNSRHRKRIQPPSMIIEALELKPGMKIVEIGCGPGTFTMDVAKAVLPKGVVYAVDIQQSMLNQLKANMQKLDITNIVPILADAGGTIPLDAEVADGAFAVTVLPEIPDKSAVLSEVKRLLKTDGLFCDAELIIDPDWPLRRTVKRWCAEAGFEFVRDLGNALRYVLVFRNN